MTESAIDAISYHQLHRRENEHTRYVSTAGTPSPRTLDTLSLAINGMPAGSAVVAATDADEAGRILAQRVQELVARRGGDVAFIEHRPEPAVGKDWNVVLQRMERDYIRTVPFARAREGRGR